QRGAPSRAEAWRARHRALLGAGPDALPDARRDSRGAAARARLLAGIRRPGSLRRAHGRTAAGGARRRQQDPPAPAAAHSPHGPVAGQAVGHARRHATARPTRADIFPSGVTMTGLRPVAVITGASSGIGAALARVRAWGRRWLACSPPMATTLRWWDAASPCLRRWRTTSRRAEKTVRWSSPST